MPSQIRSSARPAGRHAGKGQRATKAAPGDAGAPLAPSPGATQSAAPAAAAAPCPCRFERGGALCEAHAVMLDVTTRLRVLKAAAHQEHAPEVKFVLEAQGGAEMVLQEHVRDALLAWRIGQPVLPLYSDYLNFLRRSRAWTTWFFVYLTEANAPFRGEVDVPGAMGDLLDTTKHAVHAPYVGALHAHSDWPMQDCLLAVAAAKKCSACVELLVADYKTMREAVRAGMASTVADIVREDGCTDAEAAEKAVASFEISVLDRVQDPLWAALERGDDLGHAHIFGLIADTVLGEPQTPYVCKQLSEMRLLLLLRQPQHVRAMAACLADARARHAPEPEHADLVELAVAVSLDIDLMKSVLRRDRAVFVWLDWMQTALRWNAGRPLDADLGLQHLFGLRPAWAEIPALERAATAPFLVLEAARAAPKEVALWLARQDRGLVPQAVAGAALGRRAGLVADLLALLPKGRAWPLDACAVDVGLFDTTPKIVRLLADRGAFSPARLLQGVLRARRPDLVPDTGHDGRWDDDDLCRCALQSALPGVIEGRAPSDLFLLAPRALPGVAYYLLQQAVTVQPPEQPFSAAFVRAASALPLCAALEASLLQACLAHGWTEDALRWHLPPKALLRHRLTGSVLPLAARSS